MTSDIKEDKLRSVDNVQPNKGLDPYRQRPANEKLEERRSCIHDNQIITLDKTTNELADDDWIETDRQTKYKQMNKCAESKQ